MRIVISLVFAAALVAGGACKKDADAPGAHGAHGGVHGAQTEGAAVATAVIEPRSGSKVTGTATFTATPDGVQVVVEVANATPGEHAVHAHEKGDCSAADAASAGPHFNPAGHPHGLPAQPADQRHLGDFGNLTADAAGTGRLAITVAGANLKDGDPHSYLGRAIIVHAAPDDGSQPAGNAGGRVGCGVIESGGKGAPAPK